MDSFLSEFDTKDFDPISYINSNFPNESSLSNLDGHIETLKNELETINTSIMNTIQEHALINLDIQNQVARSKNTIYNILNDVSSIKEKAESSETLVSEMCKDIKSLDIAKKNLTFSITALKKFVMMVNAIDNLRDFCESRQYREVANLISAIDEFFIYFKKYESVAQIQSLYREKDTIVTDLKKQIREDFASFGRGTNTFSAETMKDACMLVEALGISFRDEIIKQTREIILGPYNEEFSKPENATIELIERRYPWILRKLKEVEEKYYDVFPHYWGLKCFILREFCSCTYVHLMDIFEKKANQIEVVSLLKALQSTLKFEQKITDELKKEYAIYLEENNDKDDISIGDSDTKNKRKSQIKSDSRQFVIDKLPKFKGIISDSFEQHMKPYVDKEEKELRENILKSLSQDGYDENSDVKIFNSSLMLFNNFIAIMKRASQYSRSQTMFSIFNFFKRAIKFYVDELLNTLIREEKNKAKNETYFELFSCLIVNTGENCKEQLEGLAGKIKEYLEPFFAEKVDLKNEEDLFVSLSQKGIESLLNNLDAKIDFSFSNMYKINWEKVIDSGDASEYVREVQVMLNSHIKMIKGILSDNYFVFYLNKVAGIINNRFLSNFYKIKKITDIALQKMRLDLYELRTSLVNLVKLDNGKNTTNLMVISSFTMYVTKIFTKPENIMKTLELSNDKFLETIRTGFDESDIEKMMILKGIKKSDSSFLKIFKNN